MDQDKITQDITKAGAGRLARSGLKIGANVLRYLLMSLAPVITSLGVMLVLFFLLFTVLFLFPKDMMDSKIPEAGAKVVTIFNLGEDDDWTEEMDSQLAQQYHEYSDRSWQQGLQSTEELKSSLDPIFTSDIESGKLLSQQTQAKPHRLPWSILAGVDRMAGDPIIHGDGLERKPNPEYHNEKLKPVFKWKTFSVVKVKKETVKNTDGTTSVNYIPYTGSVYLLDTAKTFEGNYQYHWTEEKTYFDNGHLKSVMPKIETVEKNGPYFQPLIDLMAEYNITDLFEVETVLELAELYDDEYAIDAGILGNRVEAFQLDITKQYFTGPKGPTCLPVPIEHFTITSPFGMRKHPIAKENRMHTGIDIGAPAGAPIYSAWDGVVIWAGNKGGYGKCIIVDHGDLKTLYGHLSVISTARGTEVKGGDKIGLVGSTGQSTGPHLHFEVYKTTKGGGISYENPLDYLK